MQDQHSDFAALIDDENLEGVSTTSITALVPEVDTKPIERLTATMIRLDEAKKKNSSLTFDYNTKKGLASAKSHVAELRRLKKPAVNACDEAMEPYKDKIAQIKQCRESLVSAIDQMIEPHEKAIKEEKRKEEDRVSGHRLVIDSMALNYLSLLTPEDVANKRAQIASIDTSLLEEFAAEARLNQLASLERLDEIGARLQREAEQQEELERLRALVAAPTSPTGQAEPPAAPVCPTQPATNQTRTGPTGSAEQPPQSSPVADNDRMTEVFSFYQNLLKRLQTFIGQEDAELVAGAIVNGEFSDLLTIKASPVEQEIAW
jgi:hypothetical protein